MANLRLSPGSGHRTPHRTPDRFIPTLVNASSFRMGAPTSELTPEERLMRRYVTGSATRNRSVSPTRRPGSGESPRPNRRLSAGGVGMFAVGIPAGLAPDNAIPSTPLQRGREIDGNIFSNRRSPERERQAHESRISAALGIDRAQRVFHYGPERDMMPVSPRGDRFGRGGIPGSPGMVPNHKDELWAATLAGQNGELTLYQQHQKKNVTRSVPTTPFRVLDAPGLRDDYYCSLIAYSVHTHSLAVGLHSDVYTWQEATGARPFKQWSSAHVTSLAFSCAMKTNNILAIGRIDGSLTLWHPEERVPRIDHPHSASIACIAWKPTVSQRVARNPGGGYSPLSDDLLLRKITVHSQQICGLAWRRDGEQFVTGGNDNTAYLFELNKVEGPYNQQGFRTIIDEPLTADGAKYTWNHGAAVKAIAFCPWQETLVATGGGSNDRGIHFFHTGTGVCLRTINVSAQVTSLIWSTNHREIAATLGYANPDHPVRIVVYNWPECKQVVSVPWQEEMRALFAVAYPGGPHISEGSLTQKRRESEGCIVVAASDETVRFHEIWSPDRREVYASSGVLGGSYILEQIEGIEREGPEIIR
ncbi:WD40-repeat-containing domain protein [Pyronema omphalodes]|nr:WD40-repeat-containing domain protein [Pyronema omphalodes]